MTAIHPEPRQEPQQQRQYKDDTDRQLEALEKSLEYVKAELLSCAIRRRSQEPFVEVDGGSQKPSYKNRNFSDTIQNFFDEEIETEHDLSAELELRKASLEETGASFLSSSSLDAVTSSSVDGDEDPRELFETANETCKVDISDFDLTTVSDNLSFSASHMRSAVKGRYDADIPEDPDQADMFYSAETFEDELPTPQADAPSGDILQFKRVSSLELEPHNSIPFSSKQETEKPSHDLLKLTKDVSELELDVSVTSQQSNISQRSNRSDQNEETLVNSRQRRINTFREKCKDNLGEERFTEVYNYIKTARYGEQTVPDDEVVSTLKGMVGDKVNYCFNVDQLIYLERPMQMYPT